MRRFCYLKKNRAEFRLWTRKTKEMDLNPEEKGGEGGTCSETRGKEMATNFYTVVHFNQFETIDVYTAMLCLSPRDFHHCAALKLPFETNAEWRGQRSRLTVCILVCACQGRLRQNIRTTTCNYRTKNGTTSGQNDQNDAVSNATSAG